jgi:hypothetical protein
MRLNLGTTGVLVLATLAACESPSSTMATVEKSSSAYRNSFDFVWQSSLDELRIAWQIESEDRAKRTITTAWAVNLSPFSHLGRRDRLIVTIGGDMQSGWRATAKQESETNNNEENPLDQAKAKWEPVPNDGGLAARFLQNLDTRLQPDERWRERLER